MSKKKKNLEYITSIVVRCTAMFHHRWTIIKLKRKEKKRDEHEREQLESGALTVSDTRTPQ